MGSELVSGFETGVERGLRDEAGVDGGLRGVGAGGAMVSPSKPPSWSISVVPGSESVAWPQDEQNFAFAGAFAPHVEQYIGGRDFITGSRDAANASEALHEMRSTCTAVPYARTSVTPCITSVAS